MYAITVSALMAMLFTWSFALHSPANSQLRPRLTADVIAANFWSYREAAIDFLTANSGHEGAIPDGELETLYAMDGFVKASWPNRSGGAPTNGSWAATVQNGKLYVYSTAPPPSGVAVAIAARGGGSRSVVVSEAGAGAPTISSVAGVDGMRSVPIEAGIIGNVSGNVIVIGR